LGVDCAIVAVNPPFFPVALVEKKVSEVHLDLNAFQIRYPDCSAPSVWPAK